MPVQKAFRLRVSARPGLSESSRRFAETTLNRPGRVPVPVSSQKLLADLLKRQARRVCAEITECLTNTIPAHLARLDDLREIVRHHLLHDLRETAEALPSGAQLVYASTLADWLAVLEITRRDHRCPAFVNSRDLQLEKIFRGIDQIAGLISARPGLVEFLSEGGEL